MALNSSEQFEGVWSATPTPFTSEWQIDIASLKRLVKHHIEIGVKGLFLGGTCGEGAWMSARELRKLVREAVAVSEGKLVIAVQVSDNSTTRILDNIAHAQEDGADVVVIAPPHFVMNPYPNTLKELYLNSIRQSPLPVCFYDLGRHRNLSPSLDLLEEIYAEPNVFAIKDSSSDTERMQLALQSRTKRPNLRLLTGDEFRCAEYLEAGYDGLMLGGAAFHGYLAGQIVKAVADGESEKAHALQKRLNRIMYAVYGGENIECWLSGEKKILKDLGIFDTINNYPNYPLTERCIADIEAVLSNDADVLLPPIKA
jgi:dihydrodipicolinate synthase/N-acetylneuraminate lyase